jgi:hypothetical protein
MPNAKFYWDNEFVIVKNYDEFVNTITEKYNNGEFPEIISFDHDLADEHYAPQEIWDKPSEVQKRMEFFKEKTGYSCAQWLVDFCIQRAENLPRYVVHSMNPVGAQNILGLLEGYRRHQLKGGLL